MAQTLDQIIASLGSVYDPQVQSVQAQQAALPQQQQNDQAALQGQQTQAFNSILTGARQRGTGVAFGGIPLGEQAQYNATTYQPALANLYSSYNAKAGGLNDAINQINANRAQNAQGIYQFQVQQDQAAAQLAEQQRQFNETLAQQKATAAASAAAAGSFNPSYSNGQSSGADPAAAPTGVAGAHAQMTQRKGGGFNYTDGQGHAINAAQYAHITGQNFRDVLQQAANNGDAGSRAALAFVGNDYGYNPNAVTSQQQADLYKALTGRTAVVHQAPGPSVHSQVVNAGNSLLHNNIFSGYNNSGAAKALAAQKAAHGGHL